MIESPNKLEIKGKPKGIVRVSNRVKIIVILLITIIISLIAFGIVSSSNKNIQGQPKEQAVNRNLEPSIDVAKHFNKDVPDYKPHQPAEIVIKQELQLPERLEVKEEDEFAKKIKEQQIQDALRARIAATNHDSFSNNPSSVKQQTQTSNVSVNSKSSLSGTAIEGYREMAALQLAKDDHNKQIRKEKFLLSASEIDEDNYLRSIKKQPLSKYEIKAGHLIPAVMISGINSDLPGQLIAQVRENVYDSVTGEYLLIPQGTRLIGTYDSQIAYGQERVLIVWNRLILPDGDSINLQAMPGADTSGYAGFHDSVNNHFFRTFSSAILMSMITAGTQISQPHTTMSANQVPTPSQTIAASVGAQAMQTSNNLIQRNLNVQPTLEIRPGYLFNVMVNKDMVLG